MQFAATSDKAGLQHFGGDAVRRRLRLASHSLQATRPFCRGPERQVGAAVVEHQHGPREGRFSGKVRRWLPGVSGDIPFAATERHPQRLSGHANRVASRAALTEGLVEAGSRCRCLTVVHRPRVCHDLSESFVMQDRRCGCGWPCRASCCLFRILSKTAGEVEQRWQTPGRRVAAHRADPADQFPHANFDIFAKGVFEVQHTLAAVTGVMNHVRRIRTGDDVNQILDLTHFIKRRRLRIHCLTDEEAFFFVVQRRNAIALRCTDVDMYLYRPGGRLPLNGV